MFVYRRHAHRGRPQGTEQIDEKTEDNITLVPELIVELEEDIILEERPQGTEQTEITKENSASENSDAK